ncbi:hypothetical protein HBI95_189710 [Parastagonospora nodorum]|nr:hypothetical protein HBI95_189710 [Parastagonospora nodorum]
MLSIYPRSISANTVLYYSYVLSLLIITTIDSLTVILPQSEEDSELSEEEDGIDPEDWEDSGFGDGRDDEDEDEDGDSSRVRGRNRVTCTPVRPTKVSRMSEGATSTTTLDLLPSSGSSPTADTTSSLATTAAATSRVKH